MKTKPHPALSLAAIALLAGCATPADSNLLDVTLVNFEVAREGGGLGEAAMDFSIRLQNASPEALKVTGGSHRIYLNGVYVGQGLSNETTEVPRLGTATQEVTVHLSTLLLARSFYRISQSHTASYRIESTVYGEQNGHSRKFRLTKEGSVDGEALGIPAPAGNGTP